MDGSPDPALERACRIVAFKDSQPLRRALFRRKADRTPAIRAALATWERLGTVRQRTAFVCAYAGKSFLEVSLPTRDAVLWSACQYRNEVRQIEALAKLVPDLSLATIELSGPAPSTPREWARALRRSDVGAALEIIGAYAAGGDFLVAARVASTVGYWLRMLDGLARARARAVIVSSDANPYATALVHAARSLGRRTCFVTHGHVAESPPPLAFDLAILDGPAVRDVYARAGAIEGEVVFRGVEGHVLPMRTAGLRGQAPTLGVFLSILVDATRAAAAVSDLRRRLAPKRVLYRLHPNHEMRDPNWARHFDLRDAIVSEGERSIEEDTRACDVVACGNSSAHLSVLKLGVPSIYVSALDELDDDYYGFVRRAIVPRATDREAIAAFFESPSWPQKMAYFDAAYPDRQDACDQAVARALRALVR